MKRLTLALVFLLFAWGVQASGGNVHYEASGTSDFSVTFKSMAQGFAVLASSNPITIIAYASTTAVDTMYVEAGNSMFFYCPANHIHIDRTLATAVTINPTFNNTIIPNLGMSTGNIVDALGTPTPVSTTYTDLASGINMRDSVGVLYFWTGTRTYPLTAGQCIDGAKGILLQFSWTTWKSGGVNAFKLQNVYSASPTDTVCASGVGGVLKAATDTIDCGDSTGVWKGQNLANVNGTATVYIPLTAGAGHHFIRITPHSKVMYIYGLTIRARYVW